ncbi:KN motif and ankyrin repeat domain-containing protein 3 isoform X3 [Brienomyrus brachyistius]|uniref:KN motif and ankyrin repeat domain-containing protein 3 isoform X3 n=1 Tax=Brienomyrus brachyistius TaxID=42636 RepID=UPI0020B32A32|nr:KN motif and ankyrin repeat domain-containing protein 3 isoform X3 [Brienomyrus brachyistius]
MTQSVQVNQKLPDLGAPFIYNTQDKGDQGGSYSVQTPYGFQLDLDFLKYVEEIESGHNFRRALANPRRGTRGAKISQRSPWGGGHNSGWTSTESLSSSASEEGQVAPKPPPRNRTTSAPSEVHLLSPLPVLSPPLSAGLKVPPLPPVRNPRVERTLLETSRRLQQEQQQIENDSAFQLGDPPKAKSRDVGLAANNQTQEVQLLNVLTVSPSPSQSSWNPESPHNSGMSTPAHGSASATGLAPVCSGQLQTVREQMAAALKQLKEMEEKVKGVPMLEREVAQLRAEKDRLLLALYEKTLAGASELQQHNGAERLPAAPPTHGRVSKLVELRRLTEKLGGRDEKEGDQPERVSPVGNVTLLTRSVAVGDDKPLEESVFYYCQGKKDAFVGTAVAVADKGVGMEAVAMQEAGVDVRVETKEAAVWVMESMLGLTSEAQREIDTLQESLEVLKGRLSQADEELETLKAQEQQRSSIVMVEKAVLAKPEVAVADVATECPASSFLHSSGSEKVSIAVECHCEVTDACVGPDSASSQNDQNVQTDLTESTGKTSVIAVSSTGSQWENPYEEERNRPDQMPLSIITKRRQITECAPSAIPINTTEGDHEVNATPCSPAAGMLKSIMKRNDGSGPSELRTGNKKSLKFVGILSGGYESTSSEEDDEEEDGEGGDSSSGVSGAGVSSDSSDEGEALEDTSDDEKDLNLEDSDSAVEEPIGAESKDVEGHQDTVKEKFELSTKTREACLILKNHLNDHTNAFKSREVLSSTHTVQMEWFRVSSTKTAQPSRVSDYLMAFSEVSPALLAHVVNMTDGNGNTALHYSVSHSNFKVVELLLDTGMCDVDQQNKAGYTSIMLAALAAVKEEEDMRVVKKLLGQGDVNAKASQTVNAKASQAGQTALMLAVSHGRREMAELLLACSADVNAQDEEGSTALMCASEHGRAEIVSLLLEQPGCDISIADNDGSNALSIALEAAHNDIAVLLYAHMNYSKSQASAAPKPHV